MPPLSKDQRKQLRKLAHHLEAAVLVGKQGVTPTLIKAANDSLEAHELIKVRFNSFKDQKQPLLDEIAEGTHSEIVSVVGHVATLYREQEDEEKRKIELR